MSSSAIRDSTKCRPSKHSSSPATHAEQGRAGHPADQPDHHHDHQRARRRPRRPASRTGPCRTPSRPARSATCRPPGGPPSRRGPSRARRGCRRGSPRWPCAVDVLAGVAEVQQRPRVLGVVGLVEEELVRRAELPQPQEQRQQHRPRWRRPSRRTGPRARSRRTARSAARRDARGRRRYARARSVRPGSEAASPARRSSRSARLRGVLVLAATPIGRVDDASPRLAAGAGHRRRGRRRGHPAAGAG